MFVKTKTAAPYDLVVVTGLKDHFEVRPLMQVIQQPWNGNGIELQIGKPMLLKQDGEIVLQTGEVLGIYG